MKRFLLIASAAALLMTSCSEEKFLNITGVEEATNAGKGTISFQASRPNQSRANLETFSDNFGIFGIKANDKADIDANVLTTADSEIKHTSTETTEHAQLVFNDYLVGNHKTYPLVNNEGINETGSTPTPTFTSDWYYEGLGTNEYNYPTGFETSKTSAWKNQYLKYWDASKTYTYFVAYSPYDNTDNSPILKKGKDDYYLFKLEYPNKIRLDSVNQFMVAARQEVNALHVTEGNSKYVPLKFNHFQPQIRIAFYEVIKGYKVEMINVKDATGSDPAYGVTALPYDDTKSDRWGEMALQRKINVDIVKDDSGVDKDLSCEFSYAEAETGDNGHAPLNFNVDQKVRMVSPKGNPTDYLKEERTNKAFSSTVYNVFRSTPMDATDLQFVLSFKLIAEDTKEEIVVKNARVIIPKEYTVWNDNSVYTYIFKITKDTNGSTTTPTEYDPLTPEAPSSTQALYPIIFDQLTVESMKDGNSTEYTLYDAGHNPTATNGFIFKSGLVGTPAAGKDFAEITFGNENFDLSPYMISSSDPDYKDKDYQTLLTEARAQLDLNPGDAGYDESYISPFTFTSDNPAIANVDTKGYVSALNPGQTTIHVEYKYTDASSGTITVKDAINVEIVIKNSFLKDAKQNFQVNRPYYLTDILTTGHVLSNVEWTLFNSTTNKYDITLTTGSTEDYNYNSVTGEISFKKPGEIYRVKAVYDQGSTSPAGTRYLTDYLFIEVENNTFLAINADCERDKDYALNSWLTDVSDPTKVIWYINGVNIKDYPTTSDYVYTEATNAIKFISDVGSTYTIETTYANTPTISEYMAIKVITPVIP